jgi:hypothetical protein
MSESLIIAIDSVDLIPPGSLMPWVDAGCTTL